MLGRPPAPELEAALLNLRVELGDYLGRYRADGVIEAWVSGPGSLTELADLEAPEVHCFVLPDSPAAAQQDALKSLGYRPVPAQPERWTHPGGWTLVLGDVSRLEALETQALTSWLAAHPAEQANYRAAYQRLGRAGADALCWPQAQRAAMEAEGFGPVQRLADVLGPLDSPWVVASGWALEAFLDQRTRLHHDLDVALPLSAQRQVHGLLAPEWRLDACVKGEYHAWNGEAFDGFQVHARRPGWPMLDLMFGGLETPLWHYRRDASLTLPLAQACRVSPRGWPYLAPEAVLLFKAGRPGSVPRRKDQEDFERVLPALGDAAVQWLAAAIRRSDAAHPWLAALG